MNAADLVDGSPLRVALDAGLSEIGAQLDDLSNLDMLGATELDLDLSAPLGAEFDISQLIQEPEIAELDPNSRVVVSGAPIEGGTVSANAEALQEGCPTNVTAAAVAAAVAERGRSPVPVPVSAAQVGSATNPMDIPPNLVAGRGRGQQAGGGGGAKAPVVVGELSRTPSFGISGPAAVSSILRMGGEVAMPAAMPAAMGSSGGGISRQSSLDMNTIMQVRRV